MEKSKGALIGGIIMLFLFLALVSLTIVGAASLDRYELTYEDTIPKTYAFHEYKIHTGKNAKCLIYVEEEEKPLKIFSIFLSSVNRETLMRISDGDTVTCYVTDIKSEDYAYELVEAKSHKGNILTLDEYNAEHRSNQTVGCWLGGFFSLFSLFFAVVALIHYYKPNRFTSSLFVRF